MMVTLWKTIVSEVSEAGRAPNLRAADNVVGDLMIQKFSRSFGYSPESPGKDYIFERGYSPGSHRKFMPLIEGTKGKPFFKEQHDGLGIRSMLRWDGLRERFYLVDEVTIVDGSGLAMPEQGEMKESSYDWNSNAVVLRRILSIS